MSVTVDIACVAGSIFYTYLVGESIQLENCTFFRFQNVAGKDLNIFLEACSLLLVWIEETYKLINNNKPHPIDEDALHEYKEKLKVVIYFK